MKVLRGDHGGHCPPEIFLAPSLAPTFLEMYKILNFEYIVNAKYPYGMQILVNAFTEILIFWNKVKNAKYGQQKSKIEWNARMYIYLIVLKSCVADIGWG